MNTPSLFAMAPIAILLMGAFNVLAAELLPEVHAPDTPRMALLRLQYLLFGPTIFATGAACYFWLARHSKRGQNEKVGELSFWLMFIGFNVAFFPTSLRRGAPALLSEPMKLLFGDAGQLVSVGALTFAVGFAISIWDFALAICRQPPQASAARGDSMHNVEE